jgi:hypothetical protein
MISEVQRERVGIQIRLLMKVGLLVFSNIVVKERNRDNEGNVFIVIGPDDFQQLLFFVG